MKHRSEQPGSQPIVTPDSVPNPAAVPQPAQPQIPEPTPKKPYTVPEKVPV